MKNAFYIMIMAALVAAVSCQKTEILPSEKEESQVVLYANETSSKTLLSADFKVTWADGDNLTVFNAEAGSSTYSDNCSFTITDPVNGKFVKDADDKNLVSGATAILLTFPQRIRLWGLPWCLPLMRSLIRPTTDRD